MATRTGYMVQRRDGFIVGYYEDAAEAHAVVKANNDMCSVLQWADREYMDVYMFDTRPARLVEGEES